MNLVSVWDLSLHRWVSIMADLQNHSPCKYCVVDEVKTAFQIFHILITQHSIRRKRSQCCLQRSYI